MHFISFRHSFYIIWYYNDLWHIMIFYLISKTWKWRDNKVYSSTISNSCQSLYFHLFSHHQGKLNHFELETIGEKYWNKFQTYCFWKSLMQCFASTVFLNSLNHTNIFFRWSYVTNATIVPWFSPALALFFVNFFCPYIKQILVAVRIFKLQENV